MINKPWVWGVGVVVLGLVGLAVFGSFQSKPEDINSVELSEVVIGHADGQFITLFTVFVGNKLGIFEDHGLKIRTEGMESKIAVPALLSDSIDFATISREVTTAALKGGEIKFVSLLINNQMQYLIGKTGSQPSDIKSIAVTNPASSPHYLTLKAMEKYGIEAEIRFMSTVPGVRAAVERGDADAGVFNYFAPVDFEAAGLSIMEDFGNESLLIGLSTTDRNIQEEGDKVKQTVAAFKDIAEYIQSHPDEIKPLLYEYFKYSQNVDTESRKVDRAYDDLRRFLSVTGVPTQEEKVRFVQTAKNVEFDSLDDLESIEVTEDDMGKVFDLRFVE